MIPQRARYSGGEVIAAEIVCMVSAMESFKNEGECAYRFGEDIELLALRTSGVHGGVYKSTVSKRTFKKLPVTPSKHPYFSKGVWYFRHVSEKQEWRCFSALTWLIHSISLFLRP
jgi:hypothetical protein